MVRGAANRSAHVFCSDQGWRATHADYHARGMACWLIRKPVNNDIFSKLEAYVAGEILRQSQRRIPPDAPLISSGLVDSFRLVDLALFVEDTFGVRLDDTELNSQAFDTLQQLVALIESRLAQ
jgi:acyl carrier protein